ncbi:uncharacterized protein BDV17DRAFT_163680 [Aspergillus undulatus]|uniref:uncharacterized protein n=1 Tax=Aspergillus undulatus TaxID=1810928 RepID=UPI003CCD7A18
MTMTTTTTTTTTTISRRSAECDGNCNLPQGSATSCRESCLILRLSKWLWPCRTGTPTGAVAKPSTPVDDERELEVSDNTPKEWNAFPCRACQTQGVKCDRLKPRCAHCLDQQILCFYVEPLRITMKRRKQGQMQTQGSTPASMTMPPALQEGVVMP